MSNPLLIVVAGPTASGKTAFAISLARHYKTEIVSADSRQFYRELEIGTAKPTPEELAKAPHHFINTLSIHDEYSAGKFESEALECLDRLFKVNDKAILTGGSSLFIDAVCNGLDKLPSASQAIREKYEYLLKQSGVSTLQKELKSKDAEYYETVDRDNPRRLIRALEVIELTGLPYSALRKRRPPERGFKVVKLGLKIEKEELRERINSRVDDMLEHGWLEECKSLYPFRNLTALQTVGYKEIFNFIDGECDWKTCVERIKTETWHYAKRQLTWLKRDKDINWISPSETDRAIQIIDAAARQ